MGCSKAGCGLDLACRLQFADPYLGGKMNHTNLKVKGAVVLPVTKLVTLNKFPDI